MQWSFTSPSHSGAALLKRKHSSPSIQGLVAKQQRGAMALQATPAGSNSGSGGGINSGTTPMAVEAPSAATRTEVDLEAVAAKHGWDLQQRNDWSEDKQVRWLPVAAIRRPLQGARTNDPEKVAALMTSIDDIGLLEPIDVLEVDGQYWGFSGCHRFEAHVRLGREQILCRVRKATPQVLKFHMM